MNIGTVIDLGFGDSGKAGAVDTLCRNLNAVLVVRYNGGPQSGHTVVLPSGERHVFAQFGSGTLSGVPTYLSKHMLINPLNMNIEAEVLRTKFGISPYDSVVVSPDSLIITPMHVYANRLQEELRGEYKHGSCGMGVGEAVDYNLSFPEDSIRVKDCINIQEVRNKLEIMKTRLINQFNMESDKLLENIHYKELSGIDLLDLASKYRSWARKVFCASDYNYLEEMLKKGNIVFEGSQGVLLDETYGFKPHTTWTNTTLANAEDLMEPFSGHDISNIGVIRTYTTRHGAGPLPSESTDLEALPPDKTNGPNPWQGTFRRGYLDLKLLRYSINVLKHDLDEIILSHMDEVKYFPEYKVCVDYNIHQAKINDSLLKWAKPELVTVNTPDIAHFLSNELSTLIRIVSYGPSWKDKVIAQ
jgi:adenylosuccinate synthase